MQVSNLFLNIAILFVRFFVQASQTPLNSYSNIYNVFILTVFTSEQIVWPYLQMCYKSPQWQMIFHRKSQHVSEIEAMLLPCAVYQSSLISPKHKFAAQPPWQSLGGDGGGSSFNLWCTDPHFRGQFTPCEMRAFDVPNLWDWHYPVTQIT